ncbi:MAG: hypothetical protein WAZ18_07185 [Alphaproteobacteria bacterium]
MFDAISFNIQNKLNPNTPINMGHFVECLLFYGRVDIYGNKGILKQLLHYFGFENLMTLIEEEFINILYYRDHVGIITTNNLHDIGQFQLVENNLDRDLYNIGKDFIYNPNFGRGKARKLYEKITLIKHNNKVIESTRNLISTNQDYVGQASKAVLSNLIPNFAQNYPIESIAFNTFPSSQGIQIVTNINFDTVNQIYHRNVPPSHSTITPSLILCHILDSESDLHASMNSLSDMAASTISSELTKLRLTDILSKTQTNQNHLSNFQNMVFANGHALQEAVNEEKVNLTDLMYVLRKSKKFKEWLRNKPPETNLINEFYNSLKEQTFLDKMRNKALKWCVFTGLDAITYGSTNLMFSMLDGLYIDKVLAGWKPSHFIENDLRPIIK